MNLALIISNAKLEVLQQKSRIHIGLSYHSDFDPEKMREKGQIFVVILISVMETYQNILGLGMLDRST